MRRVIFSLTFILLACSLIPTVLAGGRCISTAIAVSPTTVSVGQSMQVTAYFTNCGGNNLSNVGAKAYAYRETTDDCYTEIIPYTLIPNIGSGQTVSITSEFTPACDGDWEAVSSMHPSSLWAYGETGFTVTP